MSLATRARARGCAIALALSGVSAEIDAAPQPSWLIEATSRPVTVALGKSSHLVLVDQMDVTLAKTSRMTRLQRRAIRVLTPEGRGMAIADVVHDATSDKVKSLRAWLVRRSGEIVELDDSRALEIAKINGDLYNEIRVRMISAAAEADTGDVFAFESQLEESPPFTQLEWTFRQPAPVLCSRLSVTVPEGWEVESTSSDGEPLSPSVLGGTYQWERRNLPGIASEPNTPPFSSLAPRLGVNCRPAAGVAKVGASSFSSWAEVGRWMADIAEPSATATEDLKAKARQLVAGKRTERDSVLAIARFVQGIRYAAIELGLGRGGGYRPHPAAEVLSRSYGDCKDKANLMRAMLRAVDVPSYLVGVYLGDPGYVRESWPSPQQFNHCILAIRLRHPIEGHAAVTSPDGSRFLIFDPTSPDTPFGELPVDERGSLALVVAPDVGTLMRLPEAPPEADLEERRTEIAIQADGSMTGRIRDQLHGAAAAAERGNSERAARVEYRRKLEKWVSASTPGGRLGPFSCGEDTMSGGFRRDLEVSAPAFAQLMQKRLMVFKPLVFGGEDVPLFVEPERSLPVALAATARRESVWVQLPEGFAIDELPEAVSFEAAFGRYHSDCQVQGERLLVARSLTVSRSRLGVGSYTEVREFFARVQAARQATVVLMRR